MCEWLMFLMLVFGCETCPVEDYSALGLRPCGYYTACIDLFNQAPVRGVQFTLKGCKMKEVRTTQRTEGFFARVNQENGRVILMSLSGKTIAPGLGAIARVHLDDDVRRCVMSGQTVIRQYKPLTKGVSYGMEKSK